MSRPRSSTSGSESMSVRIGSAAAGGVESDRWGMPKEDRTGVQKISDADGRPGAGEGWKFKKG